MSLLNALEECDDLSKDDEIIASVMNTKSSFGGLRTKFFKRLSNTNTSESSSIQKSSRYSSSNTCKYTDPKKQISALPSLKLNKSISTPELSYKFRTPSTTSIKTTSKPNAYRSMNFSSLSENKKENGSKFCDSVLNTIEDSPGNERKLSNALKSCRVNTFKNTNQRVPTFQYNNGIVNYSKDCLPNRQCNTSIKEGSKIKDYQANGIKTPPKTEFSQFSSPILKTPVLTVSADLNDSFTYPPHQSSTNLNKELDSICINNKQYMLFRKIGVGGSSCVYEVMDLQEHVMRAVKIVNLPKNDMELRIGFRNEIDILKKLNSCQRVITLFDCEETPTELKLVLEAGSMDLEEILKRARNRTAALSHITIKHYWQEMLLAVQEIHEKGIIHSDLKPANFLLVGDMVKLIDFGIASSVPGDVTSIVKENPCGTFNYMSPESLIFNTCSEGDGKISVKISVKSDVWSLGCILYNMVYGKPPFHHFNNMLKVAAIRDPNTVINFPRITDENLLNTMQKCLQHHPQNRPHIKALLHHPYLQES